MDTNLAIVAGQFEQARRKENEGKAKGDKLAAASSYGTQQLIDLIDTGNALTVDEIRATA